MSARGEEEGQPRQRGTLLPARPDDEGIGLVEILVAFTIFMICFIPLLKMIPTGARIIVYSTNQRLATSIANSTLATDQNTTVPNANYTTPPVWARTASQPQPGGTTFEIYTWSGWCATSTSPGNGTVPTTSTSTTAPVSVQPPSYHIVIKVEWGSNTSPSATSQVVTDSTVLSTSTNAPPPGTSVNSCPLGLA